MMWTIVPSQARLEPWTSMQSGLVQPVQGRHPGAGPKIGLAATQGSIYTPRCWSHALDPCGTV
eukprot:1772909-Pyramimonas_sp.AAC.1